jgi:hypothetical protein
MRATPEPRQGEIEPKERRAELALIITFHKQHASRLGDEREFIDPVGRYEAAMDQVTIEGNVPDSNSCAAATTTQKCPILRA